MPTFEIRGATGLDAQENARKPATPQPQRGADKAGPPEFNIKEEATREETHVQDLEPDEVLPLLKAAE